MEALSVLEENNYQSVAIALIYTVYLYLPIVYVSAFLSSIYAEYNRNYRILSLPLIRCRSLISPQRVSTQKRHLVDICAGCST